MVKGFITEYDDVLKTVKTPIIMLIQLQTMSLLQMQKESMSDDEITQWNDKIKEHCSAGIQLCQTLFQR